jgi:DNA-directed RNA polymerase specialized sigma24 family protein
MTNGGCRDDAQRDGNDECPERELMLGYCRGEREAFDRLYARIAPWIFAELLARTGDRQRAERLLDRTFQALHASRSTYVKGADPRPWIRQMALRELHVDGRRPGSASGRPFWSRVRTAVTRSATVGLEA